MTQNNETKVTRDALRLMKVRETRTFDQQSRAGVESGKALTYQAANVLGMTFAVSSDYANNTITVTRTE